MESSITGCDQIPIHQKKEITILGSDGSGKKKLRYLLLGQSSQSQYYQKSCIDLPSFVNESWVVNQIAERCTQIPFNENIKKIVFIYRPQLLKSYNYLLTIGVQKLKSYSNTNIPILIIQNFKREFQNEEQTSQQKQLQTQLKELKTQIIKEAKWEQKQISSITQYIPKEENQQHNVQYDLSKYLLETIINDICSEQEAIKWKQLLDQKKNKEKTKKERLALIKEQSKNEFKDYCINSQGVNVQGQQNNQKKVQTQPLLPANQILNKEVSLSKHGILQKQNQENGNIHDDDGKCNCLRLFLFR